MEIELVVGMELHSQLSTSEKLFCRCSTQFGQAPNQATCPVCLGYPGAMPSLNNRAVELIVKTAMALNCTLNTYSVFARKNYFYPDLPKGYQITQFELPFGENGWIEIESPLTGNRKLNIQRIHLEEDTGKLSHEGRFGSLLDLNRAGIPLMEIVTYPEIRHPDEAHSYLSKMRNLVRYLGVCDGNMEEGSLRCEPNISIRTKGQLELNPKVELKNLNSFKSVTKGIEFEMKRQIQAREHSVKIVQETRGWDEKKQQTYVMRKKESAHDYRYFPEPDLPPVFLSETFLKQVSESLPELPEAKCERFVAQFQLSPYDAKLLTQDRSMAEFFEEVCKKLVKIPLTGKIIDQTSPPPEFKLVANFVINVLPVFFEAGSGDWEQYPLSTQKVADLLSHLISGKLSHNLAKEVLEKMIQTGDLAEKIIQEQGLEQQGDLQFLKELVENVLAQNPDEVQKYLGGKEKLLAFFVGQVMRESKGKAHPGKVNQILIESLKSKRVS